MFTGLVEDVGQIERLLRRGPGARATIRTSLGQREALELGESIAVSGVCLTVDRASELGFEADVSKETLDKTTLGGLAIGAIVNLERATKAGARLGGHVVLGHVDAPGRVVELAEVGEAWRVTFGTARELAAYLAMKGSVAVDGVSLTINHVRDEPDEVWFEVMLVPHTLAKTTLSKLSQGARVNVEVDVLARYVQRQLALAGASAQKDERTLLSKLRDGGYM